MIEVSGSEQYFVELTIPIKISKIKRFMLKNFPLGHQCVITNAVRGSLKKGYSSDSNCHSFSAGCVEIYSRRKRYLCFHNLKMWNSAAWDLCRRGSDYDSIISMGEQELKIVVPASFVKNDFNGKMSKPHKYFSAWVIDKEYGNITTCIGNYNLNYDAIRSEIKKRGETYPEGNNSLCLIDTSSGSEILSKRIPNKTFTLERIRVTI